jgi:hypothetical protein
MTMMMLVMRGSVCRLFIEHAMPLTLQQCCSQCAGQQQDQDDRRVTTRNRYHNQPHSYRQSR